MPFRSDPFGTDVFESVRLAREAAAPLESIREQMRLIGRNPFGEFPEKWRLEGSLFRDAMRPHQELVDRFREMSSGQHEYDLLRRSMVEPSVLEQIRKSAELAQTFALPAAMEQFRTPFQSLADKLLYLNGFDFARHPAYLEAFNQTSAISDFLAESTRVTRDLREAALAFSGGVVPVFDTLAGYRGFLDAAGLRLPHWPKFRLLSAAEKRRRFRARLNQKAEPSHVKKAKSLVHRYELTLREILDAVMADAYGEDWAEQRLPLCDCSDLLGKWRKRGGDVLDHADYVHYARIMSHPEHFAAVFEAGFDDPSTLASLLTDAGRLRAASHHARNFSAADLRDLRVTWRTIESGLLAFTSDVEVESWS